MFWACFYFVNIFSFLNYVSIARNVCGHYRQTCSQRFEDRKPGEGGKGLNFFFSDELGFGVDGHLWTARFAGEFQERKGYDVVPELPALFVDIGPRTPKVRLDYRDVMVALSEEGFLLDLSVDLSLLLVESLLDEDSPDSESPPDFLPPLLP